MQLPDTPPDLVGTEHDIGPIAEMRNNARLEAFKECQDNALRNLSTHTESMVKAVNNGQHVVLALVKNIQAGATVRIWSTEKIPKYHFEKLFKSRTPFCSQATTSYHLSVEIIPRGLKSPSYSIGFQDDNRVANKPYSSVFHSFSAETGLIVSPDNNLHDRIRKQLKYDISDRRYLHLVAIGKLQPHHIDSLRNLVNHSYNVTKTTGEFAKKDYFFHSSLYPTYREMSRLHKSAGGGGSANCTSFVHDIFGDLITCRSMTRIANPAWCRAHNLSDASFPGCNQQGNLLSLRETTRGMGDFHDFIEKQNQKRTRQYLTKRPRVLKNWLKAPR